MKVLFVTDVFDLYVKRDPLGLMYLSSSLKKAGHKVKASKATPPAMASAIGSFEPDVVAYSVTHPSFAAMRDLNREAKKAGRNFLSVFGGPAPTYSPELVEEDGIDAICIGEGEEALVDLVDRLDEGRPVFDTPNWHIRQGNEIFKNPVRPLVKDIDTIPEPDRDLLSSVDPGWSNYPVRSFVQSRGCPFNCSFCHNKSWRKIYKNQGASARRRSTESLIDEVLRVKTERGLQFVLFTADTFILSVEWLEKFSVEYPKRIGLPFYCMVRADLITPDLVQLLKQAGAFSVGMGIEAGNAEVRENILHKELTDEQITTAAREIHKAGINMYTFNMLGIPGSTLKDDIATLDLNIKVRSDYPMVTVATPYPQTELYEKALELGLLEDGTPCYDFSYYDQSVLKLEDRDTIENLMYLFALAVRFPVLRGLVLKACGINLRPLYYMIYRAVKGYYSWTRVFPHRLGVGGFISAVKRYLFSEHR